MTILYVFIIFFYYRQLAQGTLVRITAAASRITNKIVTIVFVYRAIQVFIAREVNKTNLKLYFGDHIFLIFARMGHFYYKKKIY